MVEAESYQQSEGTGHHQYMQQMHQQDMYGEEVDYGQEMGNTRLNEQGGDGSNALVSETDT